MPQLVTFSGLDGAGKTTQISLLTDFLEKRSVPFSCLAMYDDVSTAARLRRLLRRSKPAPSGRRERPGAGPGTAQPLRLDKNRTDLPTVAARQVVYLADLAHFLLVRRRRSGGPGSVLVMDRYFFDSLANLLSATPRTSAYVAAFSRLAPSPDLAILLDIDPEIAFARKAEYPLDYLRTRRVAYRRIFSRIRGALVVDAAQEPLQIHEQIARRMGPLVAGAGEETR